jgi:hypothetical protein
MNDDDSRWKTAFKRSRWFTRGWTLQELIASTTVEFFSKEEQLLGDKSSLQQTLHDVTGIDMEALQGRPLHLFSVEERLSWAARRITKREEDAAYCLLGIFDIHMPPIYGEGQQKAFNRLEKEIRESRNEVAFTLGCTPTEEARRNKIHQWLSAPDPSVNYLQALKQRQDSTGLWFMKSEQYYMWKTSAASSLWLYGIPGSGKTVLSSTIIQDLLESCQDDHRKAIAYFYFDFNDAQKQQAEFMLRSVICQLSRKSTSIPGGLDDLFSTHDYGQRQPSVDTLLRATNRILQELSHAYIVLDALDECVGRAELIEIVEEMARWRLENSHLIVTSRRERDIEISIETFVTRRNSVSLQSDLVDDDIRQYVRQRLSNDKGLSRWSKDASLRQEIEAAVIQGSQGMYVPNSCIIVLC